MLFCCSIVTTARLYDMLTMKTIFTVGSYGRAGSAEEPIITAG
jgi:hypothetical protein